MTRRLVFDYDYMKYAIASVCEKRTIIVTHIASGHEKEFNTRTEFYGHWKKKEGGWLGEQNKTRLEGGKEPWTADDFSIADKQVAEPVSFMNNTVKQHINNITKLLGASSYYGYIGRGASWRVDRSTIIEYKGNRKDLIKPLMLDEIESYILRAQHAVEVRGLEADDQVVIDCMKNPDLILVGVDKDYYGVEPIKYFNIDHMKEKEQHITGIGSLYVDDKGKVRGYGRKFFYFQVLSGDDTDNYCANSACPENKWGDKSAFKLLENCQTDPECWQALTDGYKKLYPEPKVITGWRGDELTVDWKYVLAENCDMAWMLRKPDERFNLDEMLGRMGVKQ
jgi:hypothetical protein